MTATLSPVQQPASAPVPAADAAPGRPPSPQSAAAGTGIGTHATPLWVDAVATVAVACFSLAVAVGYARVFSGWEFLDDAIPIVIVGHGVGLALRRLRVPALLAVPLTLLCIVWLGSVLFYRDTLAWGLPTSETWTLARFELTGVREQFRVAVAPVIYGAGWDLLAAIGLALAVVLADVFAFRAFARAETLVPGGVLFVFVGALGADRSRVALTVVLVAAGVAATIVLRWYHAGTVGATGRRAPLGRVLPAAVATVTVVALGAGLIGPRLPGAESEAIYDTRGGGGGVTTVVSPLVDIRSRLTNRSDVELFRVTADVESYWRSSALPEFDGTTWGLPDQALESAQGTLTVPAGDAVQNRQQVMIMDLGGTLVPAAPEPYQASGPDDLRWVDATSTLVTVDGDLETGDVIDVVSAAPRLDGAVLEAATSVDPGAAIYTELPADLPDTVATTAAQVTAGAQSTYEAARLLQAWFQREFTYSLEVQPGHGNNAIESFLRERVGYCEQFAGTYAAMMRTLGLPARVAVGFTSGTLQDDGTYSVLGRNAHAWPEVWFDGIGWVLFEPTPGRGAPNAEAYTGIPPQQDATPPTPDDAAAPVDAGPTTTLAAGDTQAGPNLPEEFADPTGVADAVPDVEDESIDVRPFVAALIVLLLLASPAIVRHIRRRSQSGDVEAQLARMWHDSLDAVQAAGVAIGPARTPLEAAEATAARLPVVARPFAELARVVTEATYGPETTEGFDVAGAYGQSTLRSCHNWTRQITRAVNESTTFGHRVRRYFTVWR